MLRSSRSRVVLLTAALSVGSLIAGCSSSSTSTPAATTPAATTTATTGTATTGTATTGSTGSGPATGSTLKLGIQVPIHASVDFSDAVAAAKGAARAINATGGVNGHKLEIVQCNTGLDPNKEQACARQLIGDKVVATIGNANYTNEKTVNTLFSNAGIAQVGNTPTGFSESDPNSYLFWGGQLYANAAQVYGAQKFGGTKVGNVRLDFPFTAPYPPQYKKQCASVGCQVVSYTVIASNAAVDLSPQATTLLKGNPDVIVPNLGPLQAPLMVSLDALGYKGKIIGQDSAVTAKNFFAQPVTIQDQNIVESPFPPPFAQDQYPALKQYVTEMTAEKAAGDSDAQSNFNYSNAVAMDAWMGVHVFAQVAAKTNADTAATFKTAINADHAIDLLGLATWDPSHVNYDKLPRASLDTWYYYTFQNGQPKLLNTTPVAVTDLVKTGQS